MGVGEPGPAKIAKPEGSAGTAYAVETETPTALKMIEAKPLNHDGVRLSVRAFVRSTLDV
jgi:hypothetical protein